MFEAIAVLCLAANGSCRDVLHPGFEARTKSACEALVAASPPTSDGAVTCQPIGPALDVVEVATGVFVHAGRIQVPSSANRGDVANLGFVVGADSVAVIDTGGARWVGEGLWRAIRSVTDAPVSHVILTHMHPDHVLGAAPFAEAGAKVVAHTGLPRALADRAANYLESLERLIGAAAFLGTDVVPVDITVTDRAAIDLGGRVLDLRAWPSAHTGADLTVRDGATGTFFAGDLVFHRHTPALDGSLRGWQAVMSELAGLDIQLLVPGHGDAALDWPEGLDRMQRYLDVLANDTRAALDAGARLGAAVQTIAESEAPHWDLFEDYNPRNATVAFTELEWE